MDCSPLGSSVHRIPQERILEWVAVSFSRGSSQPRIQVDSLPLSHQGLLRGKTSPAASRCYPISLLSFIAYFRSERLLSKQILNASISLPLSPQCGRPGLKPQVGKIPWRRKRQPAPVFLPGKSHGQRSLAGYSPWGYKESDTTEHTHTHIIRKD